MKKLSDYKGEEAIDLWTDLLTPITEILGDKSIAELVRKKNPPLIIAQEILASHKKEAIEILTRIDPTEVNGLNVITRIVDVILEIMNSEELSGFFSKAEQGKTSVESF